MTPVLCLVLGSIECRYKDSGTRRTLHASKLLCTEHLKKGTCSNPFSLVALEPTSVLRINRDDINVAMGTFGTESEQLRVLKMPSDTPQLPGQVPDIEDISPVHLGVATGSEVDFGNKTEAVATEAGNEEAHAPSHEPPPMVPNGYLSEEDIFEEGHKKEGQVDNERSSKSLLQRRYSHSTAGEGPLGRLNVLGHDLGWDEPVAAEEVEEQLGVKFGRLESAQMGQVTDLELEEHELDVAENLRDVMRRTPSKISVRMSNIKELGISREVEEWSRRPSRRSMGLPPQTWSEPPPQEAVTVANEDEPENVVAEGGTHTHASGHDTSGHRAVMIWLGILIDAVPESLVIGILINKSASAEDTDRFSQSAASALPFVIGVFLSNLPESMSSSGSMKLHGMRVSTILMMWLATTVLTAAGAMIGAVLFPPGSSGDQSAELVVVSVEGLAAGAMLTMIAQTMMPEAFEQGGDIVGLSCLAGFLCALSVRLIPMG